ncbi:MAG: HAMP domain-containing protein [Acidobacteria bacterium]|nr:HAMP domain-containing protein [Acidobacteriota bacterium]
MRRLGLASLLIALNAGLVLVAVAGMAAGAMSVLRQLAGRQALARTDLAAQSAALAIERAGDRVLASARLLADRRAVGPIPPAGDRAGLDAWLERFRRTSDLTGCALFSGGAAGTGGTSGSLLASAGAPLPWEELRRRAGGRAGGRTLLADDRGQLVLAGSAPLAGTPQGEAVAARVLDADYARRLSGQVGLPVALLDSREAANAAAPAARLRERALAAGAGPRTLEVGVPPAAARLDAIDRYVADRPLFGPAGGRAGVAAGVVEAALPVTAVDGPLATLSRRLMALALTIAALVTAASAAAGKWLARPMRELTGSAARLGRGDLTTPIARAPGRELGALAATLEDTRGQLLRLTAELRRRQAEGEAVLTGIAEGVFSVDRDRRIRYLNPQAAALLGMRPEEALGRFCGEVLNPRGPSGELPCEDACPIVHARFRGSARATEHLQLPGGRRRSVVVTSAGPVEERQFVMLRDETDIELARRQRDTVLANISHEFKTPLAAQRASLELLRGKLLERAAGEQSPEAHELVQSLERGGLRLTQLIDNLLESVRIESGQDGVRRRPVALDEVIEEAVELTRPLIAQRGQRVDVELPYPLPPVAGDAPRLVQVFVNLLANAQKFAPAGSSLGIGGEVTATEVALWVDDQGPGLPAAGDSGRELFRRFVRSPAAAAEPEQDGVGLGLWIVQSIVERHGGSVTAERRSPGTRLRVTLPREAEVPGAAEAGNG